MVPRSVLIGPQIRAFLAGTSVAIARCHKGDRAMKTTTNALTTLLLFTAATTSIACATSGESLRDVRSSATVATAAPSLLVSGPAMLMHVDVDAAGAAAPNLVLYAVARKQGTDADCGAGPTGDTIRLYAGRTNPVILAVPADQAACISSGGAPVSVRFHARNSENGAGGDAPRMLALGTQGR
jgi:hypothetical protein